MDPRIEKNIKKKKQALLEALEASRGIVSMACKKVGVARQTYYTYYNEDKEFAKACDDIQEIAIDFVESKLYENIDKNDTTAMIFYLKTKAKRRGYIEKTEQDVNMNSNITFKFDNTELNDEE